MKTVIIYTQAYNAEKTIKRTIESVLKQTKPDFIYYILNNGSNDLTGEIIEEYAKTDNRIVPLKNEDNNVWVKGERWLGFLDIYSDDSYFSMIDADDEYMPDYIDKMIAFIEEYNLDIAACGNEFIDAKTYVKKGERKLEKNLILKGEGFNSHFMQYYQFMRTIWGKVYSLSVLRKWNFQYRINIPYGNDTQFAIGVFMEADRVGVLAKPLHKYYIYPKSASYQFDDKRIVSDQVLFDAAYDYLLSKCGIVSHENLNFLYHVYFYAVRDTFNVLLNSQISVIEKLDKIYEVFQNRHAQELARWPGTEAQKSELFHQIGAWLLAQEEVKNGTALETAADILAAMGMYPNRIDGWQDGRVFLLLAAIKDKLNEKGSADSVDAEIVSIISKSQLAAGLSTGFLDYYRNIIYSILQHDEKTALKQMEEIIAQETDIPDQYIEEFLELGLKLSTILEYTQDFIYFKKLQISLLIDLCRIDEAREQLADWDEILPADMDFKEFRARLTP